MLRFLHLSDLHLGAKLEYLKDRSLDRQADLADAFKRAIDFACDNSNAIDAVLLAGDVFDSHNPKESVIESFGSQIDRLNNSHIPCLLVPGNHDGYEYSDSLYRRNLNGLHIFSEPEIGKPYSLRIGDTECYFYGFAYDSQRSKEPFDGFRKTNDEGIHVTLLHGSVTGESQYEAHKRHVPLNLSRLAETGMDYIALGHFHNFSEMEAGKGKAVYPGTLESKLFREIGERYLVIAELGDGHVRLNKKVFNKRTMLAEGFDLGGVNDPKKALNEYLVANVDPNLLLRLELKGSLSEPISGASFEAEFKDRFYFLEIIDNFSLFRSDYIETLSKEPSVRGLYFKQLLEGIADLDEKDRKVREIALRKGMEFFG